MASGKQIIPGVTDRMIPVKGYGGCNEGQSGTVFAIMGYLDIILQAYEITEDLLVLAILLLDIDRRKCLVEFLFKDGSDSPETVAAFEEAEASIYSVGSFAEKIATGIKIKASVAEERPSLPACARACRRAPVRTAAS
jgi:hypothetical protein